MTKSGTTSFRKSVPNLQNFLTIKYSIHCVTFQGSIKLYSALIFKKHVSPDIGVYARHSWWTQRELALISQFSFQKEN